MNREEAIKVLNSRPYTGEVREALETLIPELKESEESEEERVRKDIIGLIKFALNDGSAVSPGSHTTKEEAISWLEKQKEPVPIPDKFSGLKSLMLQYLQSAANRKDDAEIESDTDLWGRKILDYVWKYSNEQEEQKPAEWSEEDEDMRDTIIRDLKRLGGDLVKVNPAYKEEIDWLKLLPERFILQPKQEWSEEDEKIIWGLTAYIPNEELERLGVTRNDILEKLKSLRPQSKIHYWTEEEIEPIISDYLTGREHYGGMMSRLRCLKPKSHWKPSVEQMNTLLSVEGILRSLQYDDKAKILASIYEQLKKLM